MTTTTALSQLLAIMQNLRDPTHGCDWDRKQTLQSLTAYTLEEVYEVIDAIERGDFVQLRDELGDLLFQVVFYAQIANEEGHFDFGDVAQAIAAKLLHRHPHVFPDGTVQSFGSATLALDAETVAIRWEQIKNRERELKAARTPTGAVPSVLDDVPGTLPAMERGRKLQKRAASLGFDWQEPMPVLAKLREEIAELEAEMLRNDKAAMQAEFGDVLFSCVNLARHLDIDPETALRAANQKFEQRFRGMEALAAARDLRLQSLDMEALDDLWNEIKAGQGNKSA
jgi:ATP diphosphatase